MSSKLYVGNLSFDTSHQDLETTFGAFGTVESVNIIEDRDTGRSRGFGFVEMSSDDEAQKAITELDGKEVDGRQFESQRSQTARKSCEQRRRRRSLVNFFGRFIMSE